MEHIGKALDGFIKNSKIEKGLHQNKALSIWADVVGDKIAENSEAQSINSVSYTHLTLPTTPYV